MAMKEISFEAEGTRFTLTFTRQTVRSMSANGFSPDMVTKQPALGIPMLFRGAFLANHKWVKDEVKDRIYDHIQNRADLISKLLEMYAAVINSMFEDEEVEDAKKVTWDSNF